MKAWLTRNWLPLLVIGVVLAVTARHDLNTPMEGQPGQRTRRCRRISRRELRDGRGHDAAQAGRATPLEPAFGEPPPVAMWRSC